MSAGSPQEVRRTGASMNRGASKQDYATPREFLDAVEKRFGPIRHDLAADEHNRVADHYYDEHRDAFAHDWATLNGVLWLNPPFSDISPWAERAARYRDRSGFLLMLTPASTGAVWFQSFVVPNAYVLELAPRLCFDGKNPFPKDCVLSVFGYGLVGRGFWRWK